MANIYGILDLQRQQLRDISTIYNTSNVANTANLQSSLSSASNNLSAVAGATNDALNRQSDVLNIMNEENARLQAKQEQIDTARDGQKRLIMLNDSYRKRYTHYLNMMVVIVIGLAIVFALAVIQRITGFIPSGIMYILYIAIISGTLIYAGLIWTDLPNHQLIDYDVLQIKGPANPPTKNPITRQEGGNLTNPVNICANQSCCSDGTLWSEEKGQCILPPPTTTTTATSTATVQGFKTMAKPNSANEYTEYSEYK